MEMNQLYPIWKKCSVNKFTMDHDMIYYIKRVDRDICDDFLKWELTIANTSL